MVEIYAMREALVWVDSLHLDYLILETDCLQVWRALTCHSEDHLNKLPSTLLSFLICLFFFKLVGVLIIRQSCIRLGNFITCKSR